MIDYKLAKEIGATHYRECVDNEVDYYKLSYNGLTLLCYSKKYEEWDESLSTGAVVLAKIKPIPPKRTSTEYEKVTESIFDLRDEFERGELYTKKFNQEWHQIKTEEQLGNLLSMNDDPTKNGIYRKVEKEIDWTSDVMDFLRRESHDGGCVRNASIESLGDNFGCVNIDISFRHERFLELCRVALRANGELD